jgi:hypothetical protein
VTSDDTTCNADAHCETRRDQQICLLLTLPSTGLYPVVISPTAADRSLSALGFSSTSTWPVRPVAPHRIHVRVSDTESPQSHTVPSHLFDGEMCNPRRSRLIAVLYTAAEVRGGRDAVPHASGRSLEIRGCTESCIQSMMKLTYTSKGGGYLCPHLFRFTEVGIAAQAPRSAHPTLIPPKDAPHLSPRT